MYPVIKRICLRVIFFWKKKNDDAHCLKIVIPSLCMCSPTYSLAPPPSPAPAPTPTAALEVLCSDLPSVSAVRWQPPGTVPSGSASLTLRPWSSWAALSQWLSTEGTRTWPLPLHPLKRSPLTGSYTLETPSPAFSSLSFSKHQIYITILRFSLPEPLPISLYLSQTLPTPPIKPRYSQFLPLSASHSHHKTLHPIELEILDTFQTPMWVNKSCGRNNKWKGFVFFSQGCLDMVLNI